jgi:tetratricopeptide (TPR) repeat protein
MITKKNDFDAMHIFNLLALNYTRMGNVVTARKLFDAYLVKARGYNRRDHIGIALHNYGCTYVKSKDYERALQYFKDTYEYIGDDRNFYLENLYYEAFCLLAIASKNLPSDEALAKGKELSEQSEYYSLLFNSLKHLLSLKDDASIEHIEQLTIKYLTEKCEYSKAVDYCELLIEHYTRKRSRMKALEMQAKVYKLYKNMTGEC